MTDHAYHIGSRVRIELMGADSVMYMRESHVVTVGRLDRGVGIIVDRKHDDDLLLYNVAIEGRFDPHRNDLGELWVNEPEIKEVLAARVEFPRSA